jgi:hypothetical protein
MRYLVLGGFSLELEGVWMALGYASMEGGIYELFMPFCSRKHVVHEQDLFDWKR